MAYLQPTSTTFKARYPEFCPVSNALVDLVLAEAIAQVGECWLERDRARGQMLLAAHTLTMEGEPGRSFSGQGSAGTGNMTQRSVGDVSVSFAAPGSSSAGALAGIYSGSQYGIEFAALLRKNVPAVAAV